jgi:hypothetical protein
MPQNKLSVASWSPEGGWSVQDVTCQDAQAGRIRSEQPRLHYTLSTYAGNAVLDALLNNTALQKSAYASLHSGDPGLTGAAELSGNGYTRPAAAMTFAAPTGGVTDNTVASQFPTATGSNWAQATYFGAFDAATVGNFLGSGSLTTAQTILVGEYGEFAIGAFDISINTAFGTDTLANIVNALFRNTSLAVAQAYLSLHSGDPAGTGANELANANGYARAAVSCGAAGSKQCANDAVTDLGPASGSNWAAATYMGLWDSGTYGAGTFLFGKQLTTPRTIQVNKKFRLEVGGLTVTIT